MAPCFKLVGTQKWATEVGEFLRGTIHRKIQSWLNFLTPILCQKSQPGERSVVVATEPPSTYSSKITKHVFVLLVCDMIVCKSNRFKNALKMVLK